MLIGGLYSANGTASAVSPAKKGTIWVADQGDSGNPVVIIKGLKVHDNITGLDGPAGIAFTPNGQKAYVTEVGNGDLAAVSTNSESVTGTISLPLVNGGNPGPQAIAITPNGQTAYIADENEDVSVVDLATNTAESNIPIALTGGNVNCVAASPDGSTVYATILWGGTTEVAVISTATNTVTNTIPITGNPMGVAFAPGGATAYVAARVGSSSGTVSVIDTATQTVSHVIAVGGTPSGLAVSPNGKTVYVAYAPDYQHVTVIKTSNNTVTSTITGFNAPSGDQSVAFASNGKAYVANFGGGLAVVEHGAVKTTISVGGDDFLSALAIEP
jgi:YVTN family beta-propeller protein